MFPICVKCRCVVDTFETKIIMENINGIEIPQLHAYCTDCKSEVWFDFFDDLNADIYCKKVKDLENK